METFVALLCAVSVIAGAVATVAGFGIGSLLTPLVAVVIGTKLAVAFVSIPHAVGTALRFWRLRGAIDWPVFRSFGLASAAGGLAGAALHGWASNSALSAVFGALLVFAGIAGLTGFGDRLRFRGVAAIVAGVLSGFFGGLVGNQGGIRSAALLGLDLRRDAFVATATASALVVDAARVGFYAANEGAILVSLWPFLGLATACVVAGTLGGERILRHISEEVFRTIVAATLLLLGLAMLGAFLA